MFFWWISTQFHIKNPSLSTRYHSKRCVGPCRPLLILKNASRHVVMGNCEFFGDCRYQIVSAIRHLGSNHQRNLHDHFRSVFLGNKFQSPQQEGLVPTAHNTLERIRTCTWKPSFAKASGFPTVWTDWEKPVGFVLTNKWRFHKLGIIIEEQEGNNTGFLIR